MLQKETSKKALQSTISILLILCLLFLSTFSVAASASSLRINVSSVTIQQGGTYQLTAIVSPAGTNARLSWSSDNSGVATVNQNGVVTGRSSGVAVITCTANDGSGLSATCTVTVAKMITEITLSTSSLEVYTGVSKTLSASITPADATTRDLTWKSSNTSVATVNGGTITGKSPGTAVITCIAKDGSKKSATCTVTVKQGVTSIALNKTSATLGIGNTLQLAANVSPANASDKTVSWASSNSGVAKVNGNGQVTGVGSGTATITCTANDGTGVRTQCVVTVSAVSNGEHNNTPEPPNSPEAPKTTKPTGDNKTTISAEESPSDESTTEVEREVVEFSEDEFATVVDDVFGTELEGEDKKYDINELLKVRTEQKNKKSPIIVSWDTVKGFSGYEVYVAVGDKKQESFRDEDYVLIGSSTGNCFEICQFAYNQKYSFKVRTCYYEETTGETLWSDYSKPIEIVSKKQSLVEKIKMLFHKEY